MMKRILCLALAMVMLCGAAMADASKVTVTWDADLEGAKTFWAAASGDEGSTLENMAKALAELMEGLRVELIAQDNGGYLALYMKDTLVLDLGLESDWDYSRFFSSLWAEHYLSATISQEDAARSQESWEKLNAIDPEALGADMAYELVRWLDELPVKQSQGDFSGDAFEGAKLLYSYEFNDQSVARLVERLLTVAEDHGITDELLAGYLGENANVYENICRKNQEVAEANRFSYELQVACGPQKEYMGGTLLVLESGQQVMSLSHGLFQDGWQLVWGYGLNGANYYVDLEVVSLQETPGTQVGLFFVRDDQRLGFTNMEWNEESLLFMFTGAFLPQTDGKWGTIAEIMMLDQQLDWYVVEGIRHEAENNAEYAVHWYQGEVTETPLQTIRIAVEPCEPITWDADNMTPIDAEADGSDELLTQLVEENTKEMLLNLFRLVPTQLLTMLLM